MGASWSSELVENKMRFAHRPPFEGFNQLNENTFQRVLGDEIFIIYLYNFLREKSRCKGFIACWSLIVRMMVTSRTIFSKQFF